MSLQNTSETITGKKVWLDLCLEDIPGGCSLDMSRVPATCKIVKGGTPVYYVPSTRVAEIVKTAAIYAEASGGATTPKITKDHLFKATDYVTDGTVNWTISSIDTSEDAYDTLTLAGSLATTAVGTVLIQGTAGASGTTTAYYSPNGFVKEDITVGDGAALYNNADISVVVRGAVREGALPLPLTATQKTALAHFRFNA